METLNTPSPLGTALKYGLLTGLALIIFSLIIFYAGMVSNASLQWASYLLLAAGIFVGVKKHRDGDLGGFLSYGRGLGAGVLIALFAGILLALFIYVFYGFVDPGAMEEIKRLQEQALYEQGMSDDQIEKALSMISPGLMAIFTLPAITFFGFLFSLLIAAVLRKERPLFQEGD